MAKRRKVVRVGITPLGRISDKERKEIARQIEKQRERLRRLYPEVHGRVVDFISHGISDGMGLMASGLRPLNTPSPAPFRSPFPSFPNFRHLLAFYARLGIISR